MPLYRYTVVETPDRQHLQDARSTCLCLSEYGCALFNTIFVVLHAVLYGFMEVEMEGTSGWMYNSPTECSNFLTFTNYHLIMNLIIVLTVTLIVRPSFFLCRCLNSDISSVFKWLYYIMLYFAVEDESWFMANGIRYGTAPWQTNATAVWSSILVWFLFVALAIADRDVFLLRDMSAIANFALLFIINIVLTVYAFAEWNEPFGDIHRNVTLRQDYCM